MTVYILQKDNKKDFTGASRFGKLEYIIDIKSAIYPDSSEESIRALVETTRRRLDTFSPYSDYVLFMGDPVHIGITGAILAERHTIIPVLKWDNRYNDYYCVKIDISKSQDLV